MKIVGFAQLHNELEQGNLVNWFRSMWQICDHIYIYDQNSTDGSRKVYEQYSNVHVIYSETNNFINEIKCKAELLKRAKKEQPDTDWFFWMDGDTLLQGNLLSGDVHYVLNKLPTTYDGIKTGHLNLWRSDIWTRLDDHYHDLNDIGVLCFWRNKEDLAFSDYGGLHLPQYPPQVIKTIKAPWYLIHRGFATDESIIRKYNTYKERGQSGWELERLLDETTLKVQKFEGLLPLWLRPDEQNPLTKRRLKDIYDET